MLSNKSEESFIDDEMKDYIKKEVSNCNLDFHSFLLCEKIIYCLNDKLKRFVKKTLDDGYIVGTWIHCMFQRRR